MTYTLIYMKGSHLKYLKVNTDRLIIDETLPVVCGKWTRGSRLVPT